MAVLPDDILSIDPRKIKDASVEMTIVGGKIVFDRTGP
jgi:predicted amidohydrolase YtcJ